MDAVDRFPMVVLIDAGLTIRTGVAIVTLADAGGIGEAALLFRRAALVSPILTNFFLLFPPRGDEFPLQSKLAETSIGIEKFRLATNFGPGVAEAPNCSTLGLNSTRNASIWSTNDALVCDKEPH